MFSKDSVIIYRNSKSRDELIKAQIYFQINKTDFLIKLLNSGKIIEATINELSPLPESL